MRNAEYGQRPIGKQYRAQWRLALGMLPESCLSAFRLPASF